MNEKKVANEVNYVFGTYVLSNNKDYTKNTLPGSIIQHVGYMILIKYIENTSL